MLNRGEWRKQRARRLSETRISHTSDRKSIPSQRLSEPISRTAACSAANETRDMHLNEIYSMSDKEFGAFYVLQWSALRYCATLLFYC